MLISLFLILPKKKYFLLYVEGVDSDIFNKGSERNLQNLKGLYKANLKSKISFLNPPSSFLTILSGKYQYVSEYQKNKDKYLAEEKKINYQNLFQNSNLYQYFKKNKLKSKFFDQNIDLNNLDYNLIIYRYKIADNGLSEYKKLDNLILQIKKNVSFNTRIFIIFSRDFSIKESSSNLNKYLINKGFLICPEGFQDLKKCNLKKSFAYSPLNGEVYINKKNREKYGRVDWDYQGVIQDTIYVLSIQMEEEGLENFHIYQTSNYFKQIEIPEILVEKKPILKNSLILSNKKFVQNEYTDLNILNLILD